MAKGKKLEDKTKKIITKDEYNQNIFRYHKFDSINKYSEVKKKIEANWGDFSKDKPVISEKYKRRTLEENIAFLKSNKEKYSPEKYLINVGKIIKDLSKIKYRLTSNRFNYLIDELFKDRDIAKFQVENIGVRDSPKKNNYNPFYITIGHKFNLAESFLNLFSTEYRHCEKNYSLRIKRIKNEITPKGRIKKEKMAYKFYCLGCKKYFPEE